MGFNSGFKGLKYFRGDELVGIVGIKTRLPFGLYSFQIPAGARGFSLIQNIQTSSGAHQASCSMSTGILPSE